MQVCQFFLLCSCFFYTGFILSDRMRASSQQRQLSLVFDGIDALLLPCIYWKPFSRLKSGETATLSKAGLESSASPADRSRQGTPFPYHMKGLQMLHGFTKRSVVPKDHAPARKSGRPDSLHFIRNGSVSSQLQAQFHTDSPIKMGSPLFFYLLHHFVLILIDTVSRNHSAH